MQQYGALTFLYSGPGYKGWILHQPCRMHKKGAMDVMHPPPLTRFEDPLPQEPCETMYSTAPRSSSSLQLMQPPFGGMALRPFVTD